MATRPSDLKVFRGLVTGEDLETLRTHCRSLPPPPFNPLFRYFGDFGANARRIEEVRPWMVEFATRMVEAGIFERQPNQHRVTNWRGDLSAQFKWHIDNHRHGEEILAICITDKRVIGFRDPRRPDDEPYLLHLDAGDAYLIRGESRWKWEHKVIPTGQDRSGGESFVLSCRRHGDSG
jgi:alkylated DNA repair dioxygenase AlkB